MRIAGIFATGDDDLPLGVVARGTLGKDRLDTLAEM